ncbi:MAG: MoaD/ThiS family protein [Chthoniobacterales bacterium]|nr:MoaD/ThiS family protein [Chthoniobacterales bacterium]
MTVHVQLFSHLRDAAGISELDLELPAGGTVSELLTQLYARVPAVRAWHSSIIIGAGVEFVGRDHVLRAGEQIAIMPPVQGG